MPEKGERLFIYSFAKAKIVECEVRHSEDWRVWMSSPEIANGKVIKYNRRDETGDTEQAAARVAVKQMRAELEKLQERKTELIARRNALIDRYDIQDGD